MSLKKLLQQSPEKTQGLDESSTSTKSDPGELKTLMNVKNQNSQGLIQIKRKFALLIIMTNLLTFYFSFDNVEQPQTQETLIPSHYIALDLVIIPLSPLDHEVKQMNLYQKKGLQLVYENAYVKKVKDQVKAWISVDQLNANSLSFKNTYELMAIDSGLPVPQIKTINPPSTKGISREYNF